MRCDDDADERHAVENSAVEFDGPAVACWYSADRQQTLRISEWSGVLYSSIADEGGQGDECEDD